MDVRVADLGQDVWVLDTWMSGYQGITSGYLIRGDRPCLVETGAARSATTVVDALAALGIGPADLATIVVTHIHLDHAGGTGDIAAAFPRAQVVVQERGARHLVDPSRLMASARRVFGDVLDTVFGELLPTDAQRIVTIAERGDIDLGGGRTLAAYHSPGHAQHHVGLVDSATGDLYVGDAAGIYIAATDTVKPTTPPPEFDLDAARRSLQLFRDLQPTRLLFSHYGPVADVATVLDRSEDELLTWVELARQARASALDLDHAVQMVRARTAERYRTLLADPQLDARFEELSSAEANLSGILRWLDQHDPAEQTGQAGAGSPGPDASSD